MNRPFISVKWKMFNDRIDTILDIVGLQYRSVNTLNEAKMAIQRKIDFDDVNSKIEVARKKSLNFFEKAVQL